MDLFQKIGKETLEKYPFPGYSYGIAKNWTLPNEIALEFNFIEGRNGNIWNRFEPSEEKLIKEYVSSQLISVGYTPNHYQFYTSMIFTKPKRRHFWGRCGIL